MPLNGLAGKTVIVTGAAQGIGGDPGVGEGVPRRLGGKRVRRGGATDEEEDGEEFDHCVWPYMLVACCVVCAGWSIRWRSSFTVISCGESDPASW